MKYEIVSDNFICMSIAYVIVLTYFRTKTIHYETFIIHFSICFFKRAS